MILDEILKRSPVWQGRGHKTAVYSIHCCWWTSFGDDLGSSASGLPGCPHCGSVLLEAPLENFVADAKANPRHYGRYGLKAFIAAHSRNANFCYRRWTDYEAWISSRMPS